MFLFTKRAKKVVKYAWGGFSVLIILSMVVTYSGFTSLSRTQSIDDLPPEARNALLEAQNASSTLTTEETLPPELQEALRKEVSSSTASTSSKATPQPSTTTTPVPNLDFSL